MKIALVHNKYSSYGGTERYIVNLTNGLLKRGHEVHIFASRFSLEPPLGAVTHKVPLINLGRMGKDLSFALFTFNVNRDNQYDIVQGFSRIVRQDLIRSGGGVHKIYIRESLAPIKNNFLRGLKFARRTISPAHWVSRYVEGLGYKKGNHRFVMAVSEKVKRDILNVYNVPPDSVRVIHNGVDLSVFHPDSLGGDRGTIRGRYRIGDGEILLLFVATNFPLKGLEYLLKGMAKINRDDLKLLIVGGGNKRPFEAIVDNLKLKGRVIFAGKQGDLLPFYHGADILVHPTVYDPFANVCLEAMASGLPVITSRINGFSDIVADKENALLLNDPTDETEIAENIAYLLDKSKRLDMREKGIELSKQYTIDTHVDKVLSLYQEIVDLKRGE